MCRDRYFSILSNLHVNDNAQLPRNNKAKLYKIRPLISMLNKNLQKLRLPSCWQSMVLFKGHSSNKQNNPMKPIKRGYKLWCRSDMDGYTYERDVYQGKNQDYGFPTSNFGLGGDVVRKLTESLKGKNYIVAFDSYFTSPALLEYLKTQDILACGTVRPSRRGLPTLAADKSLRREDYDFRTTPHGLLYVKWRDNICVHFLSNFHGTEEVVVR